MANRKISGCLISVKTQMGSADIFCLGIKQNLKHHLLKRLVIMSRKTGQRVKMMSAAQVVETSLTGLHHKQLGQP